MLTVISRFAERNQTRFGGGLLLNSIPIRNEATFSTTCSEWQRRAPVISWRPPPSKSRNSQRKLTLSRRIGTEAGANRSRDAPLVETRLVRAVVPCIIGPTTPEKVGAPSRIRCQRFAGHRGLVALVVCAPLVESVVKPGCLSGPKSGVIPACGVLADLLGFVCPCYPSVIYSGRS